jgi:hypothetical protein
VIGGSASNGGAPHQAPQVIDRTESKHKSFQSIGGDMNVDAARLEARATPGITAWVVNGLGYTIGYAG